MKDQRVSKQYSNILIVKLGAIGDVIHALPTAHAIKQAWPAARLTWVVEKPSYDLLTNNPDIDEIIVFEKSRIKSLSGIFSYGRELRKQLRMRQFDLTLDLQGLFKSGAVAALTGAPQRLVYCNTREFSHWLSQKVCGPNRQGHVVERLLDVVRSLGVGYGSPVFPICVTAGEQAAARGMAAEAGFNMDQPYVVLLLGANWPNKRWPTESFAQLAARLQSCGIAPVLAGGSGDRESAANWKERFRLTQPPADLTGRTTLKQLAYLLQHCRAVVGGDTGPMHLAAAVGAKVAALFGPTDPGRNGPYGAGHIVLKTAYSCAGCWRRRCPEGRDCLAKISVDQVYHALMAMKAVQ